MNKEKVACGQIEYAVRIELFENLRIRVGIECGEIEAVVRIVSENGAVEREQLQIAFQLLHCCEEIDIDDLAAAVQLIEIIRSRFGERIETVRRHVKVDIDPVEDQVERHGDCQNQQCQYPCQNGIPAVFLKD